MIIYLLDNVSVLSRLHTIFEANNKDNEHLVESMAAYRLCSFLRSYEP